MPTANAARLVSTVRASALAASGAALLLAACGSRGPLDETPLPNPQRTVAPNDPIGSGPTSPLPEDAGAPPDGARGGPTITGCGSCLIDQCAPALLSCARDEVCREVLRCAVSDCLSGGSVDFACALRCGRDDLQTLLRIVGIFECVTQTCEPQCRDVLSEAEPPRGGPSPGTPGAGPGSDAGLHSGGGRRQNALSRVFASVPELVSLY